MHTPKNLSDAIAQGYAVGRQVQVHDRMRIVITNLLKRKFLEAMLAAGDKPFGPEELGALLEEILSGHK
jgi:hypothetical protein